MTDIKIPEIELFKILKDKEGMTQNQLIRELIEAMDNSIAYGKAFYFVKSLFNRSFFSQKKRDATAPMIEIRALPTGLSIKEVVVLREEWKNEDTKDVEDLFVNDIYPRITIGSR